MDPLLTGNYLMDHFVHWFSRYAQEYPQPLQNYFDENISLTPVSKDFIRFCFKRDIFLDAVKTLQSFDRHNEISDLAFKKECGF